MINQDPRNPDLFEELLRESARVAADFDADESEYDLEPQQELSDRHALRRVKGFSTELQDISDAEYRQLQLERVILVGVLVLRVAARATAQVPVPHERVSPLPRS